MTTTNEGRERLWALVNARLDERRDPLADEAIAELLLDDPEALAEVLELSAHLRALEDAREASPGRRAPWLPLTVAAGLLGLAVGAWSLRGPDAAGEPPAWTAGGELAESEPPPPNLDPTAEVHRLNITLTTERADARIVTRFDGERAERTVERRLGAPQSGEGLEAASVLATIQTTRSIGGTQP